MMPVMIQPGRIARGAARLALVALAAALTGCAAAGGATTLPWCRSERRTDDAAADSVLAGVAVHWYAPGDGEQKAALERAIRESAQRRGYRLDVESSNASWVLVRREGGRPPGAGEPPLDPSGYAAALADRVRRASPRAVAPTGATLELQLRKFGVGLWTGEVRFDPPPDDATAATEAAVRSVVWQLPRFGDRVARFERIPREEAAAYYARNLEGRAWVCPVLPYPVRFPKLERAYLRGGATLTWDDTRNAHAHDDPTVLPACLDLVRYGDDALPHAIPGYVDLAGAEIWRDATLFGTYQDEGGEEIALELRVKGDTRGYDVIGTRLLDRREADARREAGEAFARDRRRFFEGKVR